MSTNIGALKAVIDLDALMALNIKGLGIVDHVPLDLVVLYKGIEVHCDTFEEASELCRLCLAPREPAATFREAFSRRDDMPKPASTGSL